MLVLGKVKQVLVLRWKTWLQCEQGCDEARVETINPNNFGSFWGKVIMLIKSNGKFGELVRRIVHFQVVGMVCKCNQ